MDRVPEPELMDDAAQAEAYAVADFSDVNQTFVERFLNTFPGLCSGRVLDLGCGPADILIRLAQALPAVRFVGVDGSEAMLAEGARGVDAAHLGHSIELVRCLLPEVPAGPFDAVISNSLLHHLHDPMVLWETVRNAAGPGAPVLVVDLFRPGNEQEARELVERLAKDERPILKEDFYNSLLAAFRPEEVRVQLDRAGLGGFTLETISDRHMAVYGRAP